jgi:hypothetical protein
VHQVRRPDLALQDGVSNSDEIGVKSPVEPDLQFDARPLHFLKSAIDVRKRMINRFLAENVLTGTGRSDDQIGMGFGRGTDQDSIDGRIAQDFFAVCNYAGDPATLRHLSRRLPVSVSNCRRHHFGDAECQAFCMHPADSASADDSDLESLLPQSLFPSPPLGKIMFQRA